MGDTQKMTEQKKRYTILGIFVAMFLFGAFFLRETGVYFDERSEEEILYMNILQYGETLRISKITNWFEGKDEYHPICESIEKDHGSALYYLCGLLLMKLDQHSDATELKSEIWIKSDGSGAVIVNYYTLPTEYRGKIHLVSSEEEICNAREQGKMVIGCVNPTYDVLPEREDVTWLEDWKAWGNTYMRIRRY